MPESLPEESDRDRGRAAALMAAACTVCGWTRIAAVATACGRCGAPVERALGLERAAFGAKTGAMVESAFQSFSVALEARVDAGLRPIAWSGFGSTIALLGDSGRGLVLEQLELSPDEPSRVDGIGHRRIEFSYALLPLLVAPPLAGRLGTCLVTTSEIRLFMLEDPHLPQPGAILSWSAASSGERICAAGITSDGEVFVASVPEEGGAVTVRAVDGAIVAVIPGVAVAPGGGLGLAVRRRTAAADPARAILVDIWSNGRLIRQEEGGDAGTAQVFELEGLEAPALSWFERARSEMPVPWHGWRCAACGVYPVEIGSMEQRELAGLVLAGDEPRLVRYGQGRHRSVVAESCERYLIADSGGLKVIDPRTGHLVARRDEAVDADIVLSGTAGGKFFALRSHGAAEVVMRGLSVRGGELVDGFRATLRRPSQAGTGGEQPLRAVPGMGPIETDDGVLVCLEEGAGGSARARLWHGTGVFWPEPRQ